MLKLPKEVYFQEGNLGEGIPFKEAVDLCLIKYKIIFISISTGNFSRRSGRFRQYDLIKKLERSKFLPKSFKIITHLNRPKIYLKFVIHQSTNHNVVGNVNYKNILWIVLTISLM